MASRPPCRRSVAASWAAASWSADSEPPGAQVTTSDDEALRLNTLHRFRKHSPRLLLQEYSHCEVPAGCGGVVLRWIDREGGLPVVVRVAALGPVRAWLDGTEA